VTSVVNNLEIGNPALIKFPSDGEIQGNIMNYFIWNPNIDSTNINVFVKNGTVTLEGFVDSYWQKILAEELASDMEGVLGTVNKLSVVPSENIIDESIAKVIVSFLDRNPNIDIDSINVEVKDGVVILSGTVSNWAVYHDAINVASCTVGVVNVINNLTIE
jgi:osmotically-inducible protein OsmY